jgi:hypothetical protein
MKNWSMPGTVTVRNSAPRCAFNKLLKLVDGSERSSLDLLVGALGEVLQLARLQLQREEARGRGSRSIIAATGASVPAGLVVERRHVHHDSDVVQPESRLDVAQLA